MVVFYGWLQWHILAKHSCTALMIVFAATVRPFAALLLLLCLCSLMTVSMHSATKMSCEYKPAKSAGKYSSMSVF